MLKWFKKAEKPKEEDKKTLRPNHDGTIEFRNEPEEEAQLHGAPTLNRRSPTWKFIENYLQEKLTRLRAANDGYGLDHIQTSILRGRIAELNELLNLEG
jgi:hypothetical protein